MAESIGALVRRLRDERGYTQGQAVEYTNARLEKSGDPLRLTREWLSFVETGRIERPERERLEALAITFGAPAANLLAAAGYRAERVEVPEPDPIDLLRLALSKLERDQPDLEDVDLDDPAIEVMFKSAGRPWTEQEKESVRLFVQFAKRLKERQG